MSGPEVTYVSDARDGRTVVVKLGPERVVHLRPLEARALYVRLGRALDQSVEPVAPPGRLTAHQSRHLHALMREHGVEGDARHPFLSKILGREIGSVNDLTEVEADDCIGILQRTRPIRQDGAS